MFESVVAMYASFLADVFSFVTSSDGIIFILAILLVASFSLNITFYMLAELRCPEFLAIFEEFLAAKSLPSRKHGA